MDLEEKYEHVTHNLHLIESLFKHIKAEREATNAQAKSMQTLGTLLDRAKNASSIDKKMQSFEQEQRNAVDSEDFGDKSAMDFIGASSSTEGLAASKIPNHDPRAKTLKVITAKYGEKLIQTNPYVQAEQQLTKDISTLKGILMVLDDRRALIKAFNQKQDLRAKKEQKMHGNRSSEAQFELNNEVEQLRMELDHIRETVSKQNFNVTNEVRQFEQRRVQCLKELLVQLINRALVSRKRALEFWDGFRIYAA